MSLFKNSSSICFSKLYFSFSFLHFFPFYVYQRCILEFNPQRRRNEVQKLNWIHSLKKCLIKFSIEKRKLKFLEAICRTKKSEWWKNGEIFILCSVSEKNKRKKILTISRGDELFNLPAFGCQVKLKISDENWGIESQQGSYVFYLRSFIAGRHIRVFT